MNSKEKAGIIITAISLFMAILLVTLGFMWVKLRDTQMKLAELEKGTNKSFNAQQAQIDGINSNIEDINGNIDVINTNIDGINQDIEHTKAIQSNTNSALTRLRKQTEQESQELREELKKE